jgi:hypothetical protein
MGSRRPRFKRPSSANAGDMGSRSLLDGLIRGNSGAEGVDIGGYVTPPAIATMRLGY